MADGADPAARETFKHRESEIRMEATVQDQRAKYETMREEAIRESDEFKRKMAESKLAELDEQDTEVDRLQKQAEDIQDIVLPQDYSAVFGDPRANDEITSLIRQTKEQLYAQFNDELLLVHNGYKERIQVLEQAVSELTERSSESARKLQQLVEVQAERDKALREVDSLKAQINELEGLLRTYKKPVATKGGLQLTSSLKPETDEERKARLEKERIEVINRNLIARNLEPLKMPESLIQNQTASKEEPPVTDEQLEEARQEAFPGSVDEPKGDAVSGDAQPVDEAALAVTRAEYETLAERVTKLEMRLDGVA